MSVLRDVFSILDEETGEFREVQVSDERGEVLQPSRSNDHSESSTSQRQNCIVILDELTAEFRDIPIAEDSDSEMNSNQQGKRVSRKRTRNEKQWKRNQRKRKRERGQEYISSRGKTVKAKCVATKKDCLTKCKFKCSHLIDESRRKELFGAFYRLPTNEKYHYILSTTEKLPKKRSTGATPRKQYTFSFCFILNNVPIKVCKVFYLATLDISQKMVYGVHARKDKETGVPNQDQRGKHGKQKKVPLNAKNIVREHIKSFPVVESHYCRSTTQRRYLEPSLNISKMYRCYVEMCEEKHIIPVKFSMYSKIFNEEFNLSFLIPKKDRCDLCSEFEMAKKEGILNNDLKSKYEKHYKEKEEMRTERKADRDSGKAVICFDLQNVLCCPKADVSCFFYKSKLNVYNLTAHFSKGKEVYCVIWNEILSGRSGNDLASAVRLLLEKVYQDNPNLNSLILWCDSCVPQNRNSMMSYGILDFLKSHESFKEITIKYSTPGHSGIQEVDNVHSCIERVLNPAEYYSPVSLLKLMKNVRKNKPYHIILMTTSDAKDFGEYAKLLSYERVPFTKVVCLKFTQCYFHIKYKMSSFESQWISVNINPPERPRRNQQGRMNVIQYPHDLPEPKVLRLTKKGFPQHKVESIKSMYKWMPMLDKQYYQSLFREIGV